MPVGVWIVGDVLLFAIFITTQILAILILTMFVNEIKQHVVNEVERFGEGLGVDVCGNFFADQFINDLAIGVDMGRHDGDKGVVHGHQVNDWG